MRLIAIICSVALATLAGCARYEYDLVKPPELVRHIGTGEERVTVEPLVYGFRTYENRLVMRIMNPNEESIQLLGPQSVIVDPKNQSHPLRTQSIAPGSFIKLILPPLGPQYYPYGPTFGVGVGYHACYSDPLPYPGRSYPYYYPYYPEPLYLIVVDDSDMYYWEWEDEGKIRLSLAFQRGTKTFHDDFVIRRKKM